MSLGYAPAKADLSKILSELEQTAATRAAQALIRGGPDDERRAAAFTGVLRDLRQIHQTVQTPDEDMNASLAKFLMRTDDTKLVSVEELRARGEGVTIDVVAPEHREEDGGSLVEEVGEEEGLELCHDM